MIWLLLASSILIYLLVSDTLSKPDRGAVPVEYAKRGLFLEILGHRMPIDISLQTGRMRRVGQEKDRI